ncbi:TetR/AcrR family transcriptional regulator [Ruegeria halocynthiae]|uniref:TetR/AcrR family transcriptional regulator n=1 Tax=Ruegeria halocynthiae TaxID=985054 RepID=UPI00068A3541|nr:TetR/AcrR family transcriptional regulator [Ruegeria halocynthiae]
MGVRKISKPQQSRAVQTEIRILQAAVRVLIENGYEGFSTNHVADVAGCNIGTVYRYFPDKNAIVVRIYQDWLDQITADNQAYLEQMDQISGPADLIEGIYRENLRNMKEDDHRLAVELDKVLRLNKHVADMDRAHDAGLIALIQQYDPGAPPLVEIVEYWLDLALTLMVLVHLTPAEKRPFVIDQTAKTIRATVERYRAELG